MRWGDLSAIGALQQVRDAYANQGGSPTGNAAVTDVAAGKTFQSATAGSSATGTGIIATGNAAAGDVAIGKTFSNATTAGVTGTSTKNATVPNDAPIQPPQAFVDNIAKFIGGGVNPSVDISSQGITHLDGVTVMIGWAQDVESAGAHFDLNASVNAIPTSDVDSLLAQFILSGITTAALDVSGGTSGLPTPNPSIKAAFTVGSSPHEGW
jgi:hypothetical protein